jgi:Uma2 family endonuclease
LLEVLTLELNIPIQSLGSTTFHRRDVEGGLEPDECYYIRNEPLVRGKKRLDLANDPPPDLAIEIHITHSSLNRQEVYAALKIPELWRFDGEVLEVSQLQPDGRYALQTSSASFPSLPLPELQRFLDLAETTDETRWIRSFRDWVRATLAPGMPDRE